MPTCNLIEARQMATFQRNMNNHNMFTALLYIPLLANAETKHCQQQEFYNIELSNKHPDNGKQHSKFFINPLHAKFYLEKLSDSILLWYCRKYRTFLSFIFSKTNKSRHKGELLYMIYIFNF